MFQEMPKKEDIFKKDDWGNWVRGWYVDDLVDNFPSPIKGSWEVPDAVDVYRQVLAAAEDHSVVISAIGFATNIADLLRSGPDGHDDRNGMELVAAKVKTVVWQGGKHQHLTCTHYELFFG